MKNTTRIIAVALLLVMALTAFVACGGGKDALIGKWNGTTDGIPMTMEFTKDNKMIITAMGIKGGEFEYKVNGDKISINQYGTWVESKFSVSGDKLTITDPDGTQMTLTKEK